LFEDKLATRFKNMVPVDKLNHGYDMEAEEADGQKVHLEVKGLSAEGNVELTGNEATAARIHGQSFYLCVVSGIPDMPRCIWCATRTGWEIKTSSQSKSQIGNVNASTADSASDWM